MPTPLEIINEKPKSNEMLYLVLLVILVASFIIFIVMTPSIHETAVRMCNYSMKDNIPIFHIENNDWLETNRRPPNATPKDNNTHTQEPSPQMHQKPT